MNNTNSTVKFSIYRNSYIVTSALFVIVFAICMTLFNFVTYQASGVILYVTRIIAYVSALISAIILCLRCSIENKIKNPDIYTPPRDMFYYIKRMGFIVLMIVLMNLAASLVGTVITVFFGGIFYNIENSFFSGFFLKLPVFILYLALVYKMLVRYGFMDSQKKIFNLQFKILTYLISFIIMLPGIIYDNYFYVSALNGGYVNAQTVLSPNIGVYTVEYDGFIEMNESFGAMNVILIALTVLFTFAIQGVFFWFAYKRGKKIFIEQHIREIDYDMDENI